MLYYVVPCVLPLLEDVLEAVHRESQSLDSLNFSLETSSIYFLFPLRVKIEITWGDVRTIGGMRHSFDAFKVQKSGAPEPSAIRGFHCFRSTLYAIEKMKNVRYNPRTPPLKHFKSLMA
jgi:hypothetical protein